MTRTPDRSRRGIAGLAAIAMTAAGLFGPSAAQAAPDHTSVVSAVPSAQSPNVLNGAIGTIYDAGTKVLAGGSFTTVQNRDSTVNITRSYLMAFDKATGQVDTGFAPALSSGGEVLKILPGPTAGTAYIAGKFSTVNGVTRRRVALINVADGSLVTSFAPPAFNSAITDIVVANGRLLVGGNFTNAGAANPRAGLASLNATTGALDTYLTTALTGHHNYNGTGANAPVGVENLAVSPDGTQLVAIGNFKNADGVLHDQVVKLDLGPTSATIANWNTDRYTPRCAGNAFDSYVRDVAYSPDGSYFVIVTTGARYAGTLCDAAARWEANATGGTVQPTWINYTGGDTLLSVAISEHAVYVGGHIRWVNNSLQADRAGAGAVPRPSLAALDPVNGMPLAWNPGRHPRGYGVDELYLTPDGLWIGHDQTHIGNFSYRRERIAFFPLAGGAAPHSTATASLPGDVYQLGVAASGGGGQPLPPTTLYRVNAGGNAITATDGGPSWSADSGTTNPLRNSGSSKTSNSTVTTMDATVPAGTPQILFNSLRYDPVGGNEMEWNFPTTAGRQLIVRLYFADACACATAPGARIFDVRLDGATVLDDFDIWATTGQNRGTMKQFEITTDGNVDIDFIHGAVQNPVVSGFEILQKEFSAPTAGNNGIGRRAYDGASAVGAQTLVPAPDTTTWANTRGAFWVGGTLFYGMSGNLYRRTFNGVSFSPATLVDPYHDAVWDAVVTGSGPTGQTYAGIASNFNAEINSISGMFYSGGRLYYTLTNQQGMFWRWFSPDSGAVGADKFTVTGATGFSQAGAVFVSGNHLYVTNRLTGALSRMTWTGTAPSGAATVVSSPAVGGVDWRAGATFVGP